VPLRVTACEFSAGLFLKTWRPQGISFFRHCEHRGGFWSHCMAFSSPTRVFICSFRVAMLGDTLFAWPFYTADTPLAGVLESLVAALRLDGPWVNQEYAGFHMYLYGGKIIAEKLLSRHR